MRISFRAVLLTLALLVPICMVTAQDGGLVLTLDQQQNLADLRCPNGAALQPDGAVWWVLLDNCGGHDFALVAYDPATGAPLDPAAFPEIPLEDIDSPTYAIDRFTNALGFMPDGRLEVAFSDYDNDLFMRRWADVTTGQVTGDDAADEALNTLIGQFTQYRTFSTVFSPDRQTAVILDDTDAPSLHVLDLTSGAVLFEVANVGSIATFSSDSQRLYVNAVNDPDNFEVWDSTVSVYSLPDGALVQQAPAEFGSIYPSPDGRFVAFEAARNEVGTEELGVLDMDTGLQSNLLPIGEGAHRALTCMNDGRDMSDLDFTVTGDQWLQAVLWRSDGSGFMTLHSAGFQGTNTGCQFDVGRVRQYGINQ